MNDSTPPPHFGLVAIIFLVTSLGFAVALSYNNFAQQLIEKYSLPGSGVLIAFTNMVFFTLIAIGLLYLAWKRYPTIVEKTILRK